ncbi:MAG TPA: metallopeptidase family protein [Candidatus Saccharicenans sp.]|jgi:predicted Zn-dependent protease with MMP-like domain|nr:metallopeptidase family protein [Candidatus Saccharicenans sp.]HOL45822.1 metallopeptidase family protein [Candidatus Saccharicenans sp.]HOT68758.1 metallopeptidase family protein [Candidatus Saccharicenans sp.]HPC87600.1 metallopeptidase family protein [Candidatus Saccharicenans sp.]HPP23919.1 metallopeptidase family protein [Candidatus Saccharicenans sp.]
MKLTRDRFQQLVQEAMKAIPRKYLKQIKNVAILVEDYPPPGQNLLGLYHGVPLNHRGSYYGNVPPDVIVLYKVPIESLGASEDAVREKIEEVLLHEIGHYFGLGEETLREIEARRLKMIAKKSEKEN